MDRVLVRGCSGSGKSTLARRLAGRLGVPHVELDGLYHLAGWEPRPDEDFVSAVAAATAGPRWVADGNYRAAIEVLRGVRSNDGVATASGTRRAHVDTVVWLDLPRLQVMANVVRRTLRRLVTREQLWNGNRESVRNLFSSDPERNIVLWTWTQWPRYHREALAAAIDPDWARALTVRLSSRAEVAAFLDAVAAG